MYPNEKQVYINTQVISLPFDSCWGLGGYVIDYSVYVAHFVDDTRRYRFEYVKWNTRPIGGHAVHAGDAAKRERIIVGAFVAHEI